MSRPSADERARLLPARTSTLAKSPDYVNGIGAAIYGQASEGARFLDATGRTWLDMDMGLGSVVWGHGRPEIVEAITAQARLGICFSTPPVIEGELAERLLCRLSDFEQVQFAKNGADVTTAAVRLARRVTGRSRLIVTRYHGWHDWSALPHYGDGAALGIPGEVPGPSERVPERAAELRRALDDGAPVAAAIICPEHWDAEALWEVRRTTLRHGALLVFDEVKSGMRYGRRGVHGASGVVPDLLCLGKGLANGLALSALLGPRALMRHLPDTRFSGTHATEAIALAAALRSEGLIGDRPDWPPWEAASAALMSRLADRIAELGLSDRIAVAGYHGCFHLGDAATREEHPGLRSFLVQRLARDDIFTRGYFLPSAAHASADFVRLGDALCAALAEWRARPDGLSS